MTRNLLLDIVAFVLGLFALVYGLKLTTKKYFESEVRNNTKIRNYRKYFFGEKFFDKYGRLALPLILIISGVIIIYSVVKNYLS
ncbi:hypothetical protein A2533_00050 [Candidatus Falkowbacteria bacterium RIFOXYD2_FULL_35_9]|uniref:DUF3784 domain-containing protein n=1 Tax=Candidatus Falkowbacteria bacterium RIFOXYC2_FULL_36_12 TaxID=1798002 RepID=A0A1F5SZF4_9BACT|nr:MAG: hypothetical protein A2300_03245 [Candidatus Falkowbacteria bacterium RIFOXYB2_FULL_35_7]OGF31833.1 MAG: hypothetical protein A2478_05110 [Candidatus Falkowbacteria bacterium RIFOXYC2_FULL_36_12]OGF34644.1 MAG: hypothetical protein A2223_00660 [Candidatus Falkowbacteria bacterium RIFOXYA2_FULL_35_8]OGF45725.1 MAG: hypothetical protein A2533_00050 [Candidatus Falkowbacteria bacterium RIFOXYD2_FULL_35_9]